DTEAHGEFNPGVPPRNMDIATDKPGLVRKSPCGLGRIARLNDRGILATNPRGQPTLNIGPLEQLGARSGHDTASQRMTMCIVDCLEVVDVAQNKRQSLPHAFRLFNCSLGAKLKTAPVEQRR